MSMKRRLNFKTGAGIDFGNEKPPVAAEGFSHNFGEAKVNNSDFTQLASDGKQAANIYDQHYERINPDDISDASLSAASRVISAVHEALMGMTGINQIMLNNALLEERYGETPMSSYLIGCLMSAQRALTDMSIAAIERFADHSKAAKDASDD